MSITLKTSNELLPLVQSIHQQLFERIRLVVPEPELHHIGATAVPGALTKGDIDVLMRIEFSGFPAVVDVLKQHFQIKQLANWTPEFASFGDDTTYALPVGIQVVVKDSSVDFFLFHRDHFIENSEALTEYNGLKMARCEDGQEAYWNAKNEFLSRILAKRKK
ncbi:MAG: GrpB family protein [Verrucomicrobiota bacterium]